MNGQRVPRPVTARRHWRWLAGLAAVPLLTLGAPAASADAARSVTFHHPVRIDNPLFPLRPGTTFVFTGTINDAEGVHRHQVVFTVTDMVKRIDGVLTRVIWDRDFQDGELTEAELAFFAQSDNRSVYTMGEYPEEYDNGRFTGAPDTWISGQARAQGGILVPGHPRAGVRFVQGRAPAIEFLDVGTVKLLHTRVCATLGCFGNATLIEESSPLAPRDGKQLKYYAPGTGLVKVGAVGGDSREMMTLTRVQSLGSTDLARARTAVLSMERRAYRVSAPYRHTRPMGRYRSARCN